MSNEDTYSYFSNENETSTDTTQNETPAEQFVPLSEFQQSQEQLAALQQQYEASQQFQEKMRQAFVPETQMTPEQQQYQALNQHIDKLVADRLAPYQEQQSMYELNRGAESLGFKSTEAAQQYLTLATRTLDSKGDPVSAQLLRQFSEAWQNKTVNPDGLISFIRTNRAALDDAARSGYEGMSELFAPQSKPVAYGSVLGSNPLHQQVSSAEAELNKIAPEIAQLRANGRWDEASKMLKDFHGRYPHIKS